MSSRSKNDPLYSMRKTPTQKRAKATISAILTAAAQLILEIGYEKTTTNKIADRAGVSIGTLYDYFPGKEAIFTEVRRREDRRASDFTKRGGKTPDTVRGWLRLHTSMYLEYVRSHQMLHSALIKAVPRDVLGRDELLTYTEYVPWLSEFFRSHKEELRLADPELATFVASIVLATTDDYLAHAPEKLADPVFEDLLADLLERFLLKPDSDAANEKKIDE